MMILRLKFWLLLGFISLGFGAAASAAPYVPNDDGVILERLPNADRERAVRAQQALTLAQALEQAWNWLQLGQKYAEPRYYGYAEAALQPWWDDAQTSPKLLLLRATIKQHRHQFQAALADLNQVLKLDPRNGQAWLTQSVILAVLGNPRAALQSCLPAQRLLSRLLSANCQANALSLMGQANTAKKLLENALVLSPHGIIDEQRWALTLLAEIAWRQNQTAIAEQYFRRTLELPGRDTYLLAAFADFLLAQQRHNEVITLLAEENRTDSLLLRLAIAQQALDPKTAEPLIAQLQARFAALTQRGMTSHAGDQARLLLALQQPQMALLKAQTYWAQQHDPAAAYLLLSAARAAQQPEAATPVQQWLQQTGLQDARLNRML